MVTITFEGSGADRSVCGTLPRHDMREHLERRCIGRLPGFLALRADLLTRQPLEQLADPSAHAVAALSCTGKPWSSLCVFTAPDGTVTGLDWRPSPENARTNLHLAGACWFREEPTVEGSLEETVVQAFRSGAVVRAVFHREPAFLVCSAEEQLRACHSVLSGRLEPGVRGCSPVNGAFIQGRMDPSTAVTGTLWTAPGSVVEGDCLLSNCVILQDAVVGRGSRLRNTLVEPGVRVPVGTVLEDKYPSFLGDTE